MAARAGLARGQRTLRALRLCPNYYAGKTSKADNTQAGALEAGAERTADCDLRRCYRLAPCMTLLQLQGKLTCDGLLKKHDGRSPLNAQCSA